MCNLGYSVLLFLILSIICSNLFRIGSLLSNPIVGAMYSLPIKTFWGLNCKVNLTGLIVTVKSSKDLKNLLSTTLVIFLPLKISLISSKVIESLV